MPSFTLGTCVLFQQMECVFHNRHLALVLRQMAEYCLSWRVFGCSRCVRTEAEVIFVKHLLGSQQCPRVVVILFILGRWK